MERPAPPRTYEIGASELRRRLADVMLDVQAGTSVVVTRNGKVVARIVPPEPVGDLDFAELRVDLPDGVSATEALLVDRREARF